MASRFTLIALIVWCWSVIAFASQSVPPGYHWVAIQHHIPANILYAVALTESGWRLEQDIIRPWPWTLNVAGKSYRYRTQKSACKALHHFMRTTRLKRIDIGLGQTNLGYHGQHYRRSCDGFLPYNNLHVTAGILRECYQQHQDGSWLNAAACYHRPGGGQLARAYRARIQHQLNLIEALP